LSSAGEKYKYEDIFAANAGRVDIGGNAEKE
jgi:hypothetical protein